jgi:hypothetical protein
VTIPEDVREAMRQALEFCAGDYCMTGDRYDHFEAALAWLDAQAAAPEPDWTTAPDWAQWWAVDEDGRTYWYNRQPYVEKADDGCWDGNGKFEWNGDVTLPVGVDWRTTLRRRPEVTP